MVRASSTKTAKDKKSTTSRKSAARAVKQTASKSAASTKRATPAKTKKTAQTKTKAKSVGTKVIAPKSKSRAVAESIADKRSKTPSAESSARAKKSSRQTSKAPTPRTPELFESLAAEQDIPNIGILPPLADEPLDTEQADIEAKTPGEFRDAEVPHHPDITPDKAVKKATEIADITFSFLGFNDQILEAVRKQNFDKPTRVQALCLPYTLDGKDVAGFAQTGTGKTAVYLLTAAHKLLSQPNRVVQPHKPQVLVVVPTRELADQVAQDAKRLLGSLQLKSLAVFGGVDVERHVNELNQKIDLVVATPGRLIDLHRSKKLELDDLQLLVIDECDRMFDMGFIDDVEYVLRHLPSERVQKLLFSATGSEKVKELAFEYLEEPEYIETDPVRITPEKITQTAYAVTAEQKFPMLMGHIKANNPECAIIFTNTKVVAEWVGYKLACNGLDAEVLTGDLPQRKRMNLIKKIKDGKCSLLVATDVLSRGLHVANLSHVYNFDIPDDSESFIHRIGRTARAGATGNAITLICDDYGYNMGGVEKLLGFSIPLLPVPQSFLNAEDKSDYPFDSTGRVKVFGQTSQAPEGHEPRELRRDRPERAERPAAAGSERAAQQHPTAERGPRPESTLPHARRDGGREHPRAQGEHPQSSRPLDIPAGQRAPQTMKHAGPGATSSAGHAQPRNAQQPNQPRHAGQQSHANYPQRGPTAPAQSPGPTPVRHGQGSQPMPTGPANSGAAHQPRRDEKARETIELALQAAKKAAARRQPPTATVTQAQKRKGGKPRVTEQIDEIAAAVLSGAQEHLGGAIGNLQDRFVSRLEENFPRLSETLVRLGFFSKRFTEDR